MTQAAVPNYLPRQDFKYASPALRFGMYLSIWSASWTKDDASAKQAWGKVTPLNPDDLRRGQALVKRQQQLTAHLPADACLKIQGKAIAPFTTGLGNEHPLENGFAFLNPYGLPYLPGSGIKGVLRQAARELASGDWDALYGQPHGWSEAAITALFGLESENSTSEHQRGALIFWDALPEIHGNQLHVEIMTPHQKHYYQEEQNPHDSGQPIPISFLTVPAGSTFNFYIQCNQQLLSTTAPQLLQNQHWQSLLQAAFEHAFNWLGFGAKTAVGYGAMINPEDEQRQQAAEQQQRLQESGIQIASELWQNALLKEAHPGSGEILVAHADDPQRIAKGKYYSLLSDKAKTRFKKKKKVLLDVQVTIQGNLFEITAITQEVSPDAQ